MKNAYSHTYFLIAKNFYRKNVLFVEVGLHIHCDIKAECLRIYNHNESCYHSKAVLSLLRGGNTEITNSPSRIMASHSVVSSFLYYCYIINLFKASAILYLTLFSCTFISASGWMNVNLFF